MSELPLADLAGYVTAAADLFGMPLSSDRAAAVTAVMTRLAEFARDLTDFALADDSEIPGAIAS